MPEIAPTHAQVLVLASVKPTEEQPHNLRLGGQIVGPTCPYSSTLTARIPLHSRIGKDLAGEAVDTQRPDVLSASARILDPCFWEPEHPFCYELQLQLDQDQTCLATQAVQMGVRHLEVRRSRLRLNGQEFFLTAVRRDMVPGEGDLEAWHHAGCTAWLTHSSHELCDQSDRWGPMILHRLSPDPQACLAEVEQLRNHPSLLMWVLPEQSRESEPRRHIQAIRSLDRSRPIARIVEGNLQKSQDDRVDVLFVLADELCEISPISDRAIVAVLGGPDERSSSTPSRFVSTIQQIRTKLGDPPALAGVVL